MKPVNTASQGGDYRHEQKKPQRDKHKLLLVNLHGFDLGTSLPVRRTDTGYQSDITPQLGKTKLLLVTAFMAMEGGRNNFPK